MASSMISTKAVLIFTGIAAMSVFLIYCVPVVVDFSVSRFPILCSSWLKQPYLFIVANVIITIIIASSKYYQSIEDSKGEDYEILHCGKYKSQIEPIVSESHLRQLKTQDVDFDLGSKITVPNFVKEDVTEEKEEISEQNLINGGDEFVETRSDSNKVPSVIESEKLPPAEKLLVSDRSDHRKRVKATSKCGNKKKALKVVKPKRLETSENTWKMVTEEGKSTSLTSNFRRSDTFGPGGDVKPVLRKAETFKDVTNYRKSSTTAPVKKIKKEMSPSREELNRRVEAFIRKCKEERLESLRLD